ncbi:MAG: RNA-binding cell elongation regulator Jag/EloR [Dehalococcoidia bacterium]|nr:RNA-binding cell elongation regulator Jag/EloR [Dehalococcoidia bacterium]
MQIEVSAKTVAEAIAKAETELGVNREEMHILVLSEGKTGLFGFGSEEARIKVSVPEPIIRREPLEESAVVAKDALERLLSLMGIKATVDVRQNLGLGDPNDYTPVELDIRGEDLGILIGRRGETLSSLQFIVSLIVSRRLQQRTRISVDVEGYRVRREQTLTGLALRIADRVRANLQPVTMEPMPPNERRIVHLALQDHPDVTTHSIGEGEDRKVVVSPKDAIRLGSR